MIYGVDVSHWQGTINWQQVATAGVRFAVAKATEGNSFTDNQYTTNRAGIIRAGLLPGAYHFLLANRHAPIHQQVDRFLNVIGDPTGMLCALDTEDSSDHQPPTVNDLAAFTNEFGSRTGGHPIIQYIPRWFMVKHGWPSSGLAKYGPWWQSAYVTGTDDIQTLAAKVTDNRWQGHADWTAPTILQFTSSADVPGISSPCDANMYRGTYANLLTYTTTKAGADMAIAPADIAAIAAGVWNRQVNYTGEPPAVAIDVLARIRRQIEASTAVITKQIDSLADEITPIIRGAITEALRDVGVSIEAAVIEQIVTKVANDVRAIRWQAIP